MKARISGIRGVLTKLEYSYDSISKSQFDTDIEEITKLVNLLKDDALRFYEEKKFSQYKIDEKEDNDNDKGVIYSIINSIPFLIKQVDNSEIYEENYLIGFCENRTKELMKARAINNHNEFWKQHQTVAGNVYGSVPSELLGQENINILLDSKWIESTVDIIEFKASGFNKDRVIKYVSEKFKHYIIVDEIRTKTLLILRYNI